MAFLTAITYSTDALATDVVISSDTVGGQNFNSGTNSIQINSGINLSASDSNAIYVGGGSLSILNNGSISTNYYVIQNQGTISSLINNGSISTSSGGNVILNMGTITTLTNLGTITSSGSIIDNNGFMSAPVITTLNNLQGASGSALTLEGTLPINYNIIINSPNDYGKLSVTGSSGNMTFGIYNTSTVAAGTYASVITGIPTGNLPTKSGTFGAFNWILSATGVSNTWDLIFSSNGPSAADTQSSLTGLASRLRGSFNSISAMTNFSNTYDCNLFDVKGMCISAGGRYSTVDNPSSNSSAAVVTLGYKVSPNIRIGGFLDQSVNNNSPTGIDISNKNPMMGAFAYWNQNADGLGYQMKVANAYQDKDLSTTRDVIGTSEAGRGNTSLNSRSYVSELSYAFMYKENTLVRPYFALRHTTIEQDAYTETGVTTPLTYSALNNRTTSALMGVKFKHALTPKANLIGSLGLEQDLRNKTDQLTATGIAGLTSENLASDLHRTRPVASLGATYDIAKSQRLSGEVLVQQLPFQSTAGATAYFNYMIGF